MFRKILLIFLFCGLTVLSVALEFGCGPSTEVIALSVEGMD